jgi:hypothetical protein
MMDSRQFEKLTNDYYRSGSPEQAVEALAYLLQTPEFAQRPPQTLVAVAQFFQAVARRHPTVIAGYQALAATASDAGRRFVEAVLAQSGPAPGAPIQDGADLDQRWSEFLVSGEPGPVQEILAVLSWPDRLRERIEGFLSAKRPLDILFGRRRRRDLLNKLAPLGIRSDETGEKLNTPLDLDCHSLMKGMCIVADQAKTLQQALPKPLTATDLLYMSTKATAKWSLWSNAQRHPTVLKVCAAAAQTTTGPARLGLLQIVAAASLSADPEAAMEAAQQYLAAAPAEPEMEALLVQARRLSGVAQRHALIEQPAPDAQAELPAAEGLTHWNRCRKETAQQRSYRLNLRVRDHLHSGFADRDGLASEWNLEVVVPGRFAGQRWFWDPDSGEALADMWITIDEAHYENPGLWLPWKEPMRAAAHRGLVTEAYLAPLAGHTPTAASKQEQDGKPFIRLEFREVSLPAVAEALVFPVVPCNVQVWMEAASGLLTGVRVQARRTDGEPLDLELREVFLDYGEAIEIKRPDTLINVPPDLKPGS